MAPVTEWAQLPLGGENIFFRALSATDFEQQTAFPALFAVALLSFEQSRFFEVTDSSADGGGRILEVCGYGRDGRPAYTMR